MIYQTHISGWTHARLKYSFLYWFYYLLIVCLRFCQVICNRSEYTSFSSFLFACLFRVQMFTLHFTIATFVDYFVYFFFFRSSIIDSEYILLVTYATSTTAFCLAHYKLNDMWANTREPMAVTQQKRSKHNLIYHSRTFVFLLRDSLSRYLIRNHRLFTSIGVYFSANDLLISWRDNRKISLMDYPFDTINTETLKLSTMQKHWWSPSLFGIYLRDIDVNWFNWL